MSINPETKNTSILLTTPAPELRGLSPKLIHQLLQISAAECEKMKKREYFPEEIYTYLVTFMNFLIDAGSLENGQLSWPEEDEPEYPAAHGKLNDYVSALFYIVENEMKYPAAFLSFLFEHNILVADRNEMFVADDCTPSKKFVEEFKQYLHTMYEQMTDEGISVETTELFLNVCINFLLEYNLVTQEDLIPKTAPAQTDKLMETYLFQNAGMCAVEYKGEPQLYM